MSLKLIGAGMPRTGTMSLKVALEKLGYNQCYHMVDLMKNLSQVEDWLAVSKGQMIDWNALFTGYQAIVDIPGQRYYQELMQAYPAAKVILTTRDPERWYESLKQTIYQAHSLEIVDKTWWWLRYPLSPQRKNKILLGSLIGNILWDDYFERRFEDKDFAISVYENHLKAVRQNVPPDKLLVFDVADGWEPLCDFLGMSCPIDEPFPHVNDREYFQKFWQTLDVTATGEVAEGVNIVQQVEQNCAEYPDQIGLIYNGISVTYQQLQKRINQVAKQLHNLEVKIGDRVALCLPNCSEFVTSYFGVLKIGAVVVPLNSDLKTEELNFILADSQVKVVITNQSLQQKISVTDLPLLEQVVLVEEHTDGNRAILQTVSLSKDDPALILYTSGTTGNPKGAVLSHQNVISVVNQTIKTFGLQAEDKVLHFLPLFHSFGQTAVLGPTLYIGATLVLLAEFEARTVAQTVEHHQITTFFGVPTIYTLLKDQATAEQMQSVKRYYSGAATLPDEIGRQWAAKFGVVISEKYGSTETSLICFNNQHKPGSVGVPLDGVEIKLIDEAGAEVKSGELGEVIVRGSSVMLGYWNQLEQAVQDGWFHTGDIGRFDEDSYLYIVDRRKDMVNVGGEKVYPTEVEQVLYRHPAVAEAAVYGVPHAVLGEEVRAGIVLKAKQTVTENEIIDFCRESLAHFKLPNMVEFVESLPKGKTGKILKRVLRERFEKLDSPDESLMSLRQQLVQTVSADEQITLLKQHVKAEIRRIVGVEPGDEQSFFDLGMNSLMAIQLGNRLASGLQLSLPAMVILQYPTLDSLSQFLLEQFKHNSDSHATPSEKPVAELLQQQTYSCPLSYGQQALWFIYQNAPDSPAYNTALPLELQGNLNLTALQQALQALVNRHPVLRTTIQLVDEEPVQTVQPTGTYYWSEQRATEWSEQQLWSALKTANEKLFDLTQGPVLRANLFQTNSQRYILLLAMHHIWRDANSTNILVNELLTLYQAELSGQKVFLPSMPTSYADFVLAETAMLNSSVGEELVQYWQNQLGDENHILNLPTDYPRPAVQSYNGASVPFCLPAKLSQLLKQLSQQEKSTQFSLFLTVFQTLLHRYTGQTEIWIGTPTSTTRHHQPQFANLIGYLVNPVVLRATIDPATNFSFRELLSKTKQTVLEAIEHSAYPFPLLVKNLQSHRDLSYAPLFQVMLDFKSADFLSLKQDITGLNVSVLELAQMEGQFDLTLNIREGTHFKGRFNYNVDLFKPETIERMVRHFEVLLTAIVENPEQSVSQLPMLTENEIQQLQTWNDTTTDFPKNQTIVDLFEQQVETTPDNIAVVFEEQQLTYRELNSQANQLAHYLQSLGVKPEVLVGICVERSIEMVIGLLGILKAGGAHVPIDPSYPPARIAYMLDDSATPLLLTQSHLKKQLFELELECVVVCLDEVDFAVQETENLVVSRGANDLAYVIYTSGSTGRPKGVIVNHKALSNYVFHMHQHFVHEGRFAWLSTIAADFGNTIIFGALCSGGTLCVIDQQCALDASCLNTAFKQYKIDYLKITPTHLMSLQTQDMPVMPTRLLIVGGEASSVEWFNTLRQQYPHCQILNHYGPTEATVGVTTYLIDEGADSQNTMFPIGKPISNTHIYILDKTGQPLPPSIPGELCIAGAGLARGYFNRPELTAEKFIEVELFGKIERIYKTGDLARWLPDGNLEYLGRIDNQVKLRGFRIELGEIEAVLSQHSAVKEAVVMLYEADDNKRLVAYLKVKSEKLKVKNEEVGEPLFTELKDWLKTRLPDYMIPSHFTVLDKLPLTPNGKIDRKALPALDSNTLTENILPRDAIELQLLGVWETVLDVHPLGIDDNFFELGGHSLLAVKLMSHIQQQCGVRLPVSALFQSPTVATLAQQLRQDTTPLLTNLIPIQTKGAAIPVYGLPGTIGSVMYLYPLASYLGQQQPFYALQTPGLDGSKTPETVKSLAKYHMQALRQQQSSGPYQLIGHSSGGRVAFEMAWQLEKQGETVALLAILDTNAPNSNQPNPITDYTDLNWLSNIVSVFEEQTSIDLNLSLEHLQTLPDLETAYTQVMQTFQQHHILFAPEAPVDELKALVNTYRITVQAHISYQIPGKLYCPIYLFRASEQTPNFKLKDTREAWGWSECTHAKVEELMVPGTHETMMTRPHVKTLADKLSQYL
jgi:surfactin family lipopeptide synthetase A